jgi:hypothetical protein
LQVTKHDDPLGAGERGDTAKDRLRRWDTAGWLLTWGVGQLAVGAAAGAGAT